MQYIHLIPLRQWDIYTIYDSTNNILASATTSSTRTDGLTTGWSIKINKANFDSLSTSSLKNKTMAHEMGHVYGLKDLTLSTFSSQIMYGYVNSSMNVTTNDINGMKVVTEVHTHSGYYPKSYQKRDSSTHLVRCTICKSYIIENHTSLTNCTKCGYHN